MTTYKSFLIHSNLRCYLDHNGNLQPMFVYTEFTTLDEVKARIDRYWQEWEQWQSRRNINYAKSLQTLMADTDASDEAREQEVERFADKVNDHYERELLEDK